MNTSSSDGQVESPLRAVDIDAAEIDHYPNLISDIRDGEIHVARLRGVLSAEIAESLVERAKSAEREGRLTEVAPHFRISTLGLALDTAESLQQYLEQARLFRPQCRDFFDGLVDYHGWIENLLSGFAGGRPVEIPAREDESYIDVNIRKVPEHGRIPAHCESEQLNQPAYIHLGKLIGDSPILAFYTTLQAPKAGGELRVATMRWGDIEISEDGRSNAESVFDEYPSMNFVPEAGDTMLFDGGRLYHCITPIEGDRPRWTIGGFLCESADSARVWYWS